MKNIWQYLSLPGIFFAICVGVWSIRKPVQTGIRATSQNASIKSTNTPSYRSGEMVIKFKPGKVTAGNAQISQLLQQYAPNLLVQQTAKVFRGSVNPNQSISGRNRKTPVKKSINSEHLKAIDLADTYVITIPEGQNIETTIEALSKSPDIEYVEPNYYYSVDSLPNDPMFLDQYPDHLTGRDPNFNPPHDYQWNLKLINAQETWQLDTSSIVVAVIDSGVDINHPELGAVWVNPLEIPDNNVDDDNNGYVDDVNGANTFEHNNNIADDYDHGTHVAGIISAKTNNSVGLAGITNNTPIMAVKTMNADGTGVDTWIAEAIHYAADNGASLINMSVGGNKSNVVKDALDYATALGVIIVTSAGNGNNYSFTNYPAAYPQAITVAAVDEFGQKLDYSNYGFNVDVAAPGGGHPCGFQSKPSYCSNIISLKSSQNTNHQVDVVNQSYLRMSGTSMAAPHVTAVLATLLAQHPDFTLDDVENYLRFNSINSNPATHTEDYGWGIINATGKDFVAGTNITFDIMYPSQNSLVGREFNVKGVIQADDFSSVDVEYRTSGQGTWYKEGVTLIGSGTQPYPMDSSGNIAKIATIDFNDDTPRGEYEIRTTLNLAGGKKISDLKTVSFLQKPQTQWVNPNSGQIPFSEPIPIGEPLLADLDSDGYQEIVYTENGIHQGLYVFNHRYELLWSYPQSDQTQAVIGNFDARSPGLEIALQSTTDVKFFTASGQIISDLTLPIKTTFNFNILALDNNHNGRDELYLTRNNYLKYSLNAYEQDDALSMVNLWSIPTSEPTSNLPIAADVNGDGQNELITTNTGGQLIIVSAAGQIIATTDGRALLGIDLDHDGLQDVVSFTDNGLQAISLKNNSLASLWSIPMATDTYPSVVAGHIQNETSSQIYFQRHYLPRDEYVIGSQGNMLYSGNSLLYPESTRQRLVVADVDGNGQQSILYAGQRNIDSRIYLAQFKFDEATQSLDLISHVWHSVLPEWGDSFGKMSPIANTKTPLAIDDLDHNGKLDLVLAGIGIIEYPASGTVGWHSQYHDYHRTNAYGYEPVPSPTPTISPYDYDHDNDVDIIDIQSFLSQFPLLTIYDFNRIIQF